MQKYSNASDIGRAAYCPHSLYLIKNTKVAYSQATINARERGNQDHEALNNRVMQSDSPAFSVIYFILAIIIVGVGLWFIFG